MEWLNLILPYAIPTTGVVGFVGGWMFFRRRHRADVEMSEANTAQQMIAVLKDSYNEARKNDAEIYEKREASWMEIIKDLKQTNEKVCTRLARMEKALKEIPSCEHRAQCPVSAKLRDTASATE